jgi:hypothetical protein
VLCAHRTAEVCITSPDATPFGKVDICPLVDEAVNNDINIQAKNKTAGLYLKNFTNFLNLQVPTILQDPFPALQ